MALTKILITVKTYPTLSEKYDELVCTAGFKEDGTWIRIYPVPFRKLDYKNQYRKYQWIEMDVEKNNRDFRPESYRPCNIEKDFTVCGEIDTRHNWAIRKSIVLKHVHTNMTDLIAEAKDPSVGTSLAVLKPTRVIDFVWEASDREWDKRKLDAIAGNQAQGNLFEQESKSRLFQIAKKLPFEFSYIFTTEDGKERKMMLEDWELGMLYWNCLRDAHGDEASACRKVKEKYFDYMYQKRDLYFFLGTTQKFHNVGPNPFIIIGTFYPPKGDKSQLTLF